MLKATRVLITSFEDCSVEALFPQMDTLHHFLYHACHPSSQLALCVPW
jgi:hypothetical protein